MASPAPSAVINVQPDAQQTKQTLGAGSTYLAPDAESEAAAIEAAESSTPFAGCTVSPRIRSYLIEWLLTLIVLVVPLAIAYVFIPFRHRSISLLDPSIQQPYYKLDSLPILSVFIPTVVVPLICFVAYPLALSHYAGRMGLPPHPFSWHYTYWWSSCLIQTVGLSVLLSELMKRLIQAPRPDFLWRCFPDGIPAEIQATAAANNYIVNTKDCRIQDNSVYEDGLQSMPSEHTSLAFCMTTVLILFFWTLRRELIAHATRLGRQSRCAQRDALVARLVASGVPHRRAHKLATGVSSGSESRSPCVTFGGPSRRDPCASPELRPPTLIEPELTPSPEKVLAHAAPHIAKHGSKLKVPQAGHGGAQPSAAASASSSSASAIPVPTEALAPGDNAGRMSSSPRPEVALGGSVLSAAQAPAPAVVSFWPHSHVVYIAHILFPVGWAISTGLSRTFDHKHSFVDVLVGGVLGTSVALAVFRMHLVKFEGYHQRWNGHQDREHKEMDEQAADRQRRAQQAQRLLEHEDEDDEENQLRQQDPHTPLMQFDGAAIGPSDSQRERQPQPFTVQLHHPRPRSNSHVQLLAPQESMESLELPPIHAAQTAQEPVQLPSRTHSRERESDRAAGRTSFSNGLADHAHAHHDGAEHLNGKPHSLPGHVEELRAMDNV